MPTAALTSKGQLTVPAEVRADLRLNSGDRVSFEKAEDGLYRIRPVKGSIQSLFGILKYDGPPVTIEEMDEGIGAAVIERFERSRR